MIAVGLLYRYGYFTQRLSAAGDQEAGYEPQNFAKLPISPVRDQHGNWLSVQLGLPGRIVTGASGAATWDAPSSTCSTPTTT